MCSNQLPIGPNLVSICCRFNQIEPKFPLNLVSNFHMELELFIFQRGSWFGDRMNCKWFYFATRSKEAEAEVDRRRPDVTENNIGIGFLRDPWRILEKLRDLYGFWSIIKGFFWGILKELRDPWGGGFWRDFWRIVGVYEGSCRDY